MADGPRPESRLTIAARSFLDQAASAGVSLTLGAKAAGALPPARADWQMHQAKPAAFALEDAAQRGWCPVDPVKQFARRHGIEAMLADSERLARETFPAITNIRAELT